MANNYPTLDEMILGCDALGLETQEAWREVAKLIHEAMEREANALRSAKLALEDGSRFRQKIMATVAMTKSEAAEISAAQPEAIASQ